MHELGPIIEVNGMLKILNRQMLECSLAMRFDFDEGIAEMNGEDANNSVRRPALFCG